MFSEQITIALVNGAISAVIAAGIVWMNFRSARIEKTGEIVHKLVNSKFTELSEFYDISLRAQAASLRQLVASEKNPNDIEALERIDALLGRRGKIVNPSSKPVDSATIDPVPEKKKPVLQKPKKKH